MNGDENYFSGFFGIGEDVLDEYGAVNISLINDLPLFIDPFLLFNSEKEEFLKIHDEMIRYLKFLLEESKRYPEVTKGMLQAWFSFSEVKQTWLGFSESGNSGRGLGLDFAIGLHKGLNSIFSSFGNETITRATHMEKLCLIAKKVGRDKISDFTTNFAKEYLLKYTENFAKENLKPEQCRKFNIPKVTFNYSTKSWVTKSYYLPEFSGDYVLLTPKEILTREDTFINRTDMIRNIHEIIPSVTDEEIRFKLNDYLREILSDKKVNKSERDQEVAQMIEAHPVIIDYYIKHKEDNGAQATSESKEQVAAVEKLFIKQVSELILKLYQLGFYSVIPDSYDEAIKLVKYLKHVIEEQDGYRLFYLNGNPVRRESDLQIMFRMCCCRTPFDVNREVNNGRGPVDYKISYGKANSTLVEFKLASNSKLKQNLAKQVDVYKAASETDRAIKVIMYFTEEEQKKVDRVLNELGIAASQDIILIDARSDNKVSASNVLMIN